MSGTFPRELKRSTDSVCFNGSPRGEKCGYMDLSCCCIAAAAAASLERHMFERRIHPGNLHHIKGGVRQHPANTVRWVYSADGNNILQQ